MAKKLESTFLNMVMVLTIITIIAGTALGWVYELTKEPIANAKKIKQESAIKMVAPEFNNSPTEEKESFEVDGLNITLFPAKMNDQLVGAAVETATKKGFGGLVTLMVGFNLDGTIRNYTVLQHAETPGLGSKMEEWFRGQGRRSVLGLNPGSGTLKVANDGGEVDAITAATITSRAFLDAVQRAYNVAQEKLFSKQIQETSTVGMESVNDTVLVEDSLIQ